MKVNKKQKKEVYYKNRYKTDTPTIFVYADISYIFL